MIKKTVFVGLFLAASSAAFAADVAPVAPVNKAPATVVSAWDGAYIGGYIGGQQSKSNTTVDGWTNTQRDQVQRCYSLEEGGEKCYNVRNEYVTSSTSYPGVTNDGNVIGLSFGGWVGYNKQLHPVVVGSVELDGGWSGARDYNTIYAVTSAHRYPWNLALTGRLIFLPTKSQDTGIYVKGGLKLLNQRSELAGPSGSASEDKVKAGVTIGGGLEQKIPAWKASARVEAMWSRVTDQTISIPGATTTLKGSVVDVKAGLTWALN